MQLGRPSDDCRRRSTDQERRARFEHRDARPDRSSSIRNVMQHTERIAEILAAGGSGASSTDARWKLTLSRSASAFLATSSARDGSMQCKCPTFGAIRRAQRPEPQPMSNPDALSERLTHGNTAKYSSKMTRASSSVMADWSKRDHSSPKLATVAGSRFCFTRLPIQLVVDRPVAGHTLLQREMPLRRGDATLGDTGGCRQLE